jgi:hypothetical protein
VTARQLAFHDAMRKLEEAVDRLGGNHVAEVRDYDAIHAHNILEMADMLSAGIIKQFPARFR